ncbi:PLP-dependent aminotransferase family protein [Geodermatophilaceae bacterium NBWT11]|nr:PLP-dependent aminotransferase family protein [Geodermatophilaceae bacterium NBWT11]
MPVVTEQSTPAHELAAQLGDTDGSPRYAALARRVRELVVTGELPVGTRLPAERDLAAALGVSRVTVASAYRTLREAGFAHTRHGSGTVLELPDDRPAWNWRSGDVPGVVDLAHGASPASPLLAPAYADALTRLEAYTRGSGYVPVGLPELRAAVADRYTAQGLPTTADQVLITSGAGDAAALVWGALVEPGDRVLVQHPSYPGAIRSVELAGGRCVPVPVDAADPDALVEAARLAARQSAPRMAYLMPDHANPTGISLSATGRRRLAATLWQQGVLTVVDEIAAELVIDGDPAPHVAAGLPDAAMITVGGLSKSVWGGLRVGWLRTDAALVERLATVLGHRQLSVGLLDQLAATTLVRDLDAVLAHRREQLRTQRDALVAAVREQLPDWSLTVPSGGLCVWAQLPPGLSSAALTAAAAPAGLLLAEGRVFGTGAAFDDRLRLPFTRPPGELRSAVEVLAGLDRQLRGQATPRPAPSSTVV